MSAAFELDLLRSHWRLITEGKFQRQQNQYQLQRRRTRVSAPHRHCRSVSTRRASWPQEPPASRPHPALRCTHDASNTNPRRTLRYFSQKGIVAGKSVAPGGRSPQTAGSGRAEILPQRELREDRSQRREEQFRRRSTSFARPERTRSPGSANRDSKVCGMQAKALHGRVARFYAAVPTPVPESQVLESPGLCRSEWISRWAWPAKNKTGQRQSPGGLEPCAQWQTS